MSSSSSSGNESLEDSYAKKVLHKILDSLDPTQNTETDSESIEKSINFKNNKSDSSINSQSKAITVPIELVNGLKSTKKIEKYKVSKRNFNEVLKQLEEIKVNEQNILQKLSSCSKEKPVETKIESAEIVIRPKTSFKCESNGKKSKKNRDRCKQKCKENSYTYNVVLHKDIVKDIAHIQDQIFLNKPEVENSNKIVDLKMKSLMNELERITFELKLYHIKYGIDEEIIKKVDNLRDYFEIESDPPATHRLNPIIFDAYNDKLKSKRILIENLIQDNKRLNLEISQLRKCFVSTAKEEFNEAVKCNSNKFLQDQISETLQETIDSIKRMEKQCNYSRNTK